MNAVHTWSMERYVYEMNASLTRRHMRHANRQMSDPKQSQPERPQDTFVSRCHRAVSESLSHFNAVSYFSDRAAPRSAAIQQTQKTETEPSEKMKRNEMLQLQLQAAAAAPPVSASACQAAV